MTRLRPRPLRSVVHLFAVLLLAPVLGGATCSNRPSPKEHEQAIIHYDLGVQALQNNDARGALTEYKKAVEFDPDLDVAHHALGLVYHVSFGQTDEAIRHYRRAVELNPKFTEAYTNWGNVYLALGRFDEAIPLYEKALSDMLYRTPFIAENNLGWCYYKKGEVQTGIDHIRSALIANPKFCLGHRNLGLIYTELGQPEKATASFALYARNCPQEPDAHHRYGAALLKTGDPAAARREFEDCVEKGKDLPLGQECQNLLNLLDQQ